MEVNVEDEQLATQEEGSQELPPKDSETSLNAENQLYQYDAKNEKRSALGTQVLTEFEDSASVSSEILTTFQVLKTSAKKILSWNNDS